MRSARAIIAQIAEDGAVQLEGEGVEEGHDVTLAGPRWKVEATRARARRVMLACV